MNESVNSKNEIGACGPIIQTIPYQPPSLSAHLPRFKVPWLKAILLLLFVIGVWGAWYVVTARSVTITTEPASASVAADELIAPIIGNHWMLRPGPRTFIVSAQGYHPFRDDIEVTDEAIQNHDIQLRPLPGHLKIDISPVDTANVSLDGERSFDAPGTMRDIEAGAHEIEITAPRYLPFRKILEIEGRDIEQSLSVALNPAWADITIDSEPSGASVSFDDESVGQTPLSSEVLQGNRKITLALAGYKPWQRTLKVVAGHPISLPPVLLIKADGFVSVNTDPAGAAITIDKNYQGKSPLKVAVAPDKTHKIAAIKQGYLAASASFSVKSGDTSAVDLKLKPELAQVQVIATPKDAELLIDGKSLGAANQTIKLPTHEHQIEIKKAGYVSYTAAITPRKGIRKQIKVRLRTPKETAAKAQPAAAPAVPATAKTAKNESVIKTHLGQELKLIRGGKVTLGSSRREASRRANETLREATLKRPFYFALKEVSNGEFRRFLANHQVPSIKGNDANQDKQPVVNVSWENAALFCNWLSRQDSLPSFYQIKGGKVLGINPTATGYRLPTEAEWAFVARTTPKSTESFKYPWAGSFPPRGRTGNYADQSASGILGRVIPDYTDGFPVTAPVASFHANLYGVYDLGGNVSEWVNDVYLAAPSSKASTDPLGPRSGETHVIRGSSWSHATQTELRLAYRDSGKTGRDDLGFRIARYAQ